MRLTVVIPTYRRPDWLKRAVKSLASQTRLPDEVLVVARDTDLPTHRAIAELESASLGFPVARMQVSEPGFMPPVKAGFDSASGDVIAVMDDDAEALHDWAERLVGHYAADVVGGVGGRYINMSGDEIVEVPGTDRVGFVDGLGRFVGDMYKWPRFEHPVEVDFMIGGCMSFRREVAHSLEFDLSLNRNVAFGYEVDLGLQARSRGWTLLFDPAIAVRHYSAPREIAGLRAADDREAVYWASYNHARVALRRLRGARRFIAFLYALLVGERRAPGVIPLALAPVARHAGFVVGVGGAAFRGRMLALRSVLTRDSSIH